MSYQQQLPRIPSSHRSHRPLSCETPCPEAASLRGTCFPQWGRPALCLSSHILAFLAPWLPLRSSPLLFSGLSLRTTLLLPLLLSLLLAQVASLLAGPSPLASVLSAGLMHAWAALPEAAGSISAACCVGPVVLPRTGGLGSHEFLKK